ncbi:DUF2913 family protein [Vibrio makurazakiensis]|uniref:DUF2913 family protein n=1 Tax=Vibrio makurazakiensis TaxID=2910250 RepID=UPI003D0EB793
MHPSQLLLDICTNALLHLEFKKLERHLSVVEKNQLLVQYFKRITKSHRFRAVKKTTKGWLLAGRQANNNFEALITNEHVGLLQSCSTDLHRFVNLISMVETSLKTKVQYSKAMDIDLNVRYGKVLICVVDESLSSSFDEDGHMFHSTQLLFIGDSELKEQFSAIIDSSDHFQAIVAYEDETHLRMELLRF